MGEIKSTLDIIMEKTKGLTMTDEEKGEFKKQEARGKVKGLVQKFFDNILDLDRVKIETAALVEGESRMINQLVAEETIKSICPGENNDAGLKILESVAGVDTNPIKKILADSERKFEREKVAREVALREAFQKKGISGSAVLPNINADPELVTRLLNMKEEFEEKIKRLIAEVYPEKSI